MKAERWQQVDKLFQAAVEHAPEERAAFLSQACGGDDALRCHVEKLLAAVKDPYVRAVEFVCRAREKIAVYGPYVDQFVRSIMYGIDKAQCADIFRHCTRLFKFIDCPEDIRGGPDRQDPGSFVQQIAEHMKLELPGFNIHRQYADHDAAFVFQRPPRI